MNRFLKHLVLGTAAVCALAVPTLAADFTHCADYLNDMGLFQGGTNGYDLDRAPTRLEAGVMLVRLLGAEDAALANQTYTAPFNDVADWAKPYVQYLYDNGLGQRRRQRQIRQRQPVHRPAVHHLPAAGPGLLRRRGRRLHLRHRHGLRPEAGPGGYAQLRRDQLPPGQSGCHELYGPGHQAQERRGPIC